MVFALPMNFGDRVNRIDALLIEFRSEVVDSRKRGILREALTTYCTILEEIDYGSLLRAIEEINSKSNRDTVLTQVIGDDGHFEEFLKYTEDRAFEWAGLNNSVREHLKDALRHARTLRNSRESHQIRGILVRLKESICGAANLAREVDENASRRHEFWSRLGNFADLPNRYAWVAGGVILLVNVAALHQPLSWHGAAASIELGKRLLPGGG
jgi:hypothetical protein